MVHTHIYESLASLPAEYSTSAFNDEDRPSRELLCTRFHETILNQYLNKQCLFLLVDLDRRSCNLWRVEESFGIW